MRHHGAFYAGERDGSKKGLLSRIKCKEAFDVKEAFNVLNTV